jgi:hypothetical protein
MIKRIEVPKKLFLIIVVNFSLFTFQFLSWYCQSLIFINFLLFPLFQPTTYNSHNLFYNMRFYVIALLPLLAAAAPFPAQPNNALSDGINKNLDAGNGEIAAVQNLQSDETNKASAAVVNAGISGVQSALDIAVADRKANQALAGARRATPVQDGLAKVATAQGKAQGAINTLNGGAGDTATLSTLTSTFEKGLATNENNLALVSTISKLRWS